MLQNHTKNNILNDSKYKNDIENISQIYSPTLASPMSPIITSDSKNKKITH